MIRTLLLCMLVIWAVAGLHAQPAPADSLVYHGRQAYLLEGTPYADSVKKHLFDRFPTRMHDSVRTPVWHLSQHSAGLTLRFYSNATQLGVYWRLRFNTSMSHMAATGIKGLDLYVRTAKGWQYINTARPESEENTAMLVQGMERQWREYRLHLPLYDGIDSISLALPAGDSIRPATASNQLPVVIYGTSITQGGCASRPGMAYSHILSRLWQRPCYNFGFSGNGRMEPEIVRELAQLPAALFLIDCLPNMNAASVRRNTPQLVSLIRARQPRTPIVFVENQFYADTYLNVQKKALVAAKNTALKQAVDSLQAAGVPQLYYISQKGLLGPDAEGTVDGVHFTDLGFMRYAQALNRHIQQFQLLKE